VEEHIIGITKKLLPNYNLPLKNDGGDVEYPSDDKFEKVGYNSNF
jgi:hypothetical protein